MQERPNKLALLLAIGRFLNEDARPKLADPRLAFRALIAANLASIVASELMTEGEHLARELEKLRAIFGDAESALIPAKTEELRAEVAERSARLAKALRAGTFDGALAKVNEALRQTLKDKLSVDNSRFDTNMDIE